MADDVDEKPEWGSIACKVETYNEFHGIALEMGYPSMTEAFEDLATLRTDLAKAVEALDAVVVALSLSEERGYGSSAKRIAQSLIKELQ